MIPQEIIDLTADAYFGYISSRDVEMSPTLMRFWGLDFRASEDIAILFVVAKQSELTLKNSRQNGCLSAGFSRWPDFKTYQLKGRFLQARAMTAEEIALQQQYRIQPVKAVTIDFGYSAEQAEKFIYQTDLAIEIKVEQIFNQTPGPEAGKTIALI